MNSLSSGTDDIVSESGITVTSSAFTVSSTTYVNQSVTYNPTSSYVNYFANSDQQISISENSVLTMTPDLSWTITGSTSIAFSLSNYNSVPYPTWVSVDPVSGLLTISSTDVTTDTVNSFYINSALTSGVTGTIKELITITTMNWLVQNCQKWSISSGSVWDTCNSGYSVNAGSWSLQISSGGASTQNSSSANSQSSKNTDNTVKYIIYWACGATMLIVTTTYILDDSSMASFWSLISQVQLFFLLLLTRSFIPDNVQQVITGLKFLLNFPDVIPFKNNRMYSEYLSKFNFGLSNSLLDPIGLSSDSTLYNANSFFTLVLAFAPIFIGTFILKKMLNWCNQSQLWLLKILVWINFKFYKFFVFAYYIRSILEMTQFLLISSIYELYKCNTSGIYHRASLFTAGFVLIVILMITLYSLYLALSSYRIVESMHNKVGELFEGIKMERRFKLYASSMLIRRIIYVAILILATSIAFKSVIICLALLQIIYATYVIYLRPYEEVKCNIIDALNEVSFFLLLVTLIFINTEDQWSTFKSTIYMWVIASNSVFVLLIVSGNFRFNANSWFD